MKTLLKTILQPRLIIRFAFILSLLSVFVLIFDFGYNQFNLTQKGINIFYVIVMATGILSTAIRHLYIDKNRRGKILFFDTLSLIVTVVVLAHHFFSLDGLQNFVLQDYWIASA